MVIAIDGPAASGKGTLAKRLAAHLGRPHLDTGLLYRAVARAMLDKGWALEDAERAASMAEALDIRLFPEERLRGRHMGEAASIVSAFPAVRAALLAYQRRFAAQAGGAVLDGRDIGTVVCPDADVKLYVTASAEERARRRHLELGRAGDPASYESVLDDIVRRDQRDESRRTAPLKLATDAILIDTTRLDADAAFTRALEIVEARVA
jgi:cytidylate kinase